MTVKQLPAVPVLFFSTQTTLAELSKYVAQVAKELYAEAAKLQLLPTGPLQWIYLGADGNPDTVFTLEIALPVETFPIQSSFKTKILPAFSGAAALHTGNWNTLAATYNKLITEICAAGKQLTGVCREQYIYMDFADPNNNLTEVLVGI
jgi:effector-binding domain-containing protein